MALPAIDFLEFDSRDTEETVGMVADEMIDSVIAPLVNQVRNWLPENFKDLAEAIVAWALVKWVVKKDKYPTIYNVLKGYLKKSLSESVSLKGLIPQFTKV